MTQEEHYMLRCLELAALGAGSVAPNPMVGCVIEHNNTIIGEGYHEKLGEAHAEVNAINSVNDPSLLKQSTIYVSLEPCAHFGRTPPCADLIIKCGIPRVMVAMKDPFSQVNGAGIKRMVDAGIDVSVGILENEARELNRRFITFHEKKQPYIILKWAETADGFVDANHDGSADTALKITGGAANTLVHRWRAEEAGILIGKNTALNDNPTLTTRKFGGTDPVRILLDTNAEVPTTFNIHNTDARTIMIGQDAKDLQKVLTELYEHQIQSVIVEGGPTVHGSFYNAGLWDEARRFIAPFEIGEGVRALQMRERPENETMVGTDHLLIYRNR